MVEQLRKRFGDHGKIGMELLSGVLQGVAISAVVGVVMLYGYSQVIGTKVDTLVENTKGISTKLDAMSIQITSHISAQDVREKMIDKELEKEGLRRSRR